MKRRTVVKGALAGAGVLAAPAYLRAQSNKKLSLLTWNIADQQELFKKQFADFKSENPGVEIEWLDKKGPDLPAFYQTQIVAGTPPDVVDLQGAIWVDYAANGGLVDLTPYMQKEPDVAKLYKAFLQVARHEWARQQLLDFISGRMTASPGHAFEVASQVARSLTGDCKEYAVLTAALARSAGVPARVALGLVLLEYDGRYAAFGHAWAEIREDNKWVVADATAQKFAGAARYLPFGILEDEGPGFEMAVTRLTPVWIQRVVVLGAATTDVR